MTFSRTFTCLLMMAAFHLEEVLLLYRASSPSLLLGHLTGPSPHYCCQHVCCAASSLTNEYFGYTKMRKGKKELCLKPDWSPAVSPVRGRTLDQTKFSFLCVLFLGRTPSCSMNRSFILDFVRSYSFCFLIDYLLNALIVRRSE